jgi:hypothetical protein
LKVAERDREDSLGKRERQRERDRERERERERERQRERERERQRQRQSSCAAWILSSGTSRPPSWTWPSI